MLFNSSIVENFINQNNSLKKYFSFEKLFWKFFVFSNV